MAVGTQRNAKSKELDLFGMIQGQKVGRQVPKANYAYAAHVTLPSILRKTEEMVHQFSSRTMNKAKDRTSDTISIKEEATGKS